MNIAGLIRTDLLIDRAYIGGEWRGARKGRTVDVENPATGEILRHDSRLWRKRHARRYRCGRRCVRRLAGENCRRAVRAARALARLDP